MFSLTVGILGFAPPALTAEQTLTYRESIEAIGPMDTTGLEPKVAEILQSYYEHNFDSPRNWQNIESARFDGILHLSEGSVRFVSFKKKPDYCKIIVFIGGGRMVLSYDGADAWQFNTLEQEAEPTSMPTAEALNFIRDATTGGHLFYPLIEGKSVAFTGNSVMNGKQCYELEVVLPNGQQIRSTLDMETYAELQQITINAVNGLEERTIYGDFRTVQGVRMPYSSRMISGGQLMHRIEMLDITFNRGLMPWMFSRPSGAYMPGLSALPEAEDAPSVSLTPDPEDPFSAGTPDPSPFGDVSAFDAPVTRFPDISAEEQKLLMEEIGKSLNL